MNTINDFAGSDIIDVRDIIARVEELREEKQDLIDVVTEACEAREASPDDESLVHEHHAAMNNEEDWRSAKGEELESLESLLKELCGNGGDEQWEGDWYPVTLIKDSYFEESMDEMLEDIGTIPKDLPAFLTITVDYDMLKQDYQECEFEGDTYYYR